MFPLLDKKDEKDDIDLSSIKGFALKWYLVKLKIKKKRNNYGKYKKRERRSFIEFNFKIKLWKPLVEIPFHLIKKYWKKIKNKKLIPWW